MNYIFNYRCGMCGVIIYKEVQLRESLDINKTLRIIMSGINSLYEIPDRFLIHQCSDSNVGIAELIGCTFDKG